MACTGWCAFHLLIPTMPVTLPSFGEVMPEAEENVDVKIAADD